jgi:hypothetical protein
MMRTYDITVCMPYSDSSINWDRPKQIQVEAIDEKDAIVAAKEHGALIVLEVICVNT